MFKAEAWIERVQTEWLFSKSFATLQEAQEFIIADFVCRKNDKEFLQYGGYDIYEQTWERLNRPEIVTAPFVRFN